MGKVLVKSSIDYADEFDVHGFFIADKEEFEQELKDIKEDWEKDPGEREFYFGTNEQIIFDDFEDYKNKLNITSITDEQAQVFKDVGLGTDFGDTFHDRLVENLPWDSDD